MNEELEFAADDRLDRMSELHRIDLDSWTCICAAFMISPYHICKHLIHLFDNEYPSKQDCFRQRIILLLFINDLHSSKDREIITNPSHEPPSRLSRSSLQDIDVSQEDLRLIEAIFSQQTGDEDDPRADEVARIRIIEDFNNQL